MTDSENAKNEKPTKALLGKTGYLRNRNRIAKRNRKTIRPPSHLVEKTVLILKSYLKNVIQDAIVYASEDKRESISALDVSKALEKQEFTSYDRSFSSAIDKESFVDKDALN